MEAEGDSGSGKGTVRLQIRVYGQVQGVFFRAKAQEEARRLGLSGFARNERDGTVTVEGEGPAPAVDRMRAWCETGPPEARVERIETDCIEPIGGGGFRTL